MNLLEPRESRKLEEPLAEQSQGPEKSKGENGGWESAVAMEVSAMGLSKSDSKRSTVLAKSWRQKRWVRILGFDGLGGRYMASSTTTVRLRSLEDDEIRERGNRWMKIEVPALEKYCDGEDEDDVVEDAEEKKSGSPVKGDIGDSNIEMNGLLDSKQIRGC